MSAQAQITVIQRRALDHLYWWHSIDLGDGVVTRGFKSLQVLSDELASLQLPDMQGKTVLDIGAWDGFFSFAAERLGASRVVALDYYTWATDATTLRAGSPERRRSSARGTTASTWAGATAATPAGWDPARLPGKRGFDLARAALGSRVEVIFGDVLELDPAELGQFDIVLLLGVLYHTRHPLEMLERVAALTRETMVLETESFTLPGYEGALLGEFFEADELAGDASNWWSLTEPALAGMCRSSGFDSVRFLDPYYRDAVQANGLVRHRALAHAVKSR